MTLDEARARVKLGAELLDVHQPGWATQITQELIMRHPCFCVIGQLYNGYYHGAVKLLNGGPHGQDSRRLGFVYDPDRSLDLTDVMRDENDGYYKLELAWHDEIQIRR